MGQDIPKGSKKEGAEEYITNPPFCITYSTAACIREMHVCDTLVGMHREVNLRARKNVGTTDCARTAGAETGWVGALSGPGKADSK